MLRWTVIFLVIAIIAAIFGFTGIAAGAASIAKVIFFIFLVLVIVIPDFRIKITGQEIASDLTFGKWIKYPGFKGVRDIHMIYNLNF